MRRRRVSSHAFAVGRHQTGASLVEVLVALLLLSLGMLSLCGVLVFAVQSPKLSSHRATAVHLAASHIEAMRANAAGFYSGRYVTPLRWASAPKSTPLKPCAYPNCASGALADQDTALLSEAVRTALPSGGMQVTCHPSPCTATSQGNIWIVWQEPATYAALEAGTSNACPPETPVLPANVQTRCIHLRFAL
jgi:type IV pilus assembly protein PilV